MRQSTIIFGTLLTAFVIYITLRGQLPDYLALFGSNPAPVKTSSNAVANDNDATNNAFGGVDKGIKELFNTLGINEGFF